MRALFGRTFAKVLWDAPEPLSWQGRGAFRRFLYTVDVTDKCKGEEIAHIENVKTHQVPITWLTNGTRYIVTVRAHTDLKATGPPSKAFIGSTLNSDTDALVWSTLMPSRGKHR